MNTLLKVVLFLLSVVVCQGEKKCFTGWNVKTTRGGPDYFLKSKDPKMSNNIEYIATKDGNTDMMAILGRAANGWFIEKSRAKYCRSGYCKKTFAKVGDDVLMLKTNKRTPFFAEVSHYECVTSDYAHAKELSGKCVKVTPFSKTEVCYCKGDECNTGTLTTAPLVLLVTTIILLSF